MDRFADMFARLAACDEGAFVPFAVVGDGGDELFLEIVRSLVAGGADALELGVPSKRPIYDGPTIVKAHRRAGEAGVTARRCWGLIEQVRAAYPDLPICLMSDLPNIAGLGVTEFCSAASCAGVDAVLAVGEDGNLASRVRDAAEAAQLQSVMLCAADAGDAEISRAARFSQGFVYLVSRSGPTGAETPMGAPHPRVTRRLKGLDAPPALIGFGVSKPDHVTAALDVGAEGVICGSAIVERIEEHLSSPEALGEALSSFVETMKAACRRPQ